MHVSTRVILCVFDALAGYVDSDSEDSDSDMSDVGEIDSDIETEIGTTYDR